MKRLSLMVVLTSWMMLSSGLAHGATEITLDSMTGVYGGDSVMACQTVRWYFRLTFTPGDSSVIGGSTNGFRVWTHSGGTYTDNFTTITYDSFPWGWFMIYIGTGGLVFNDFSVDGLGADTIGFGGLRGAAGTGIPDSTDSLCWWIETMPSTDGDTLCVDSTWYPPGGEWLWVVLPSGPVNPGWDGPHCFHVVLVDTVDTDGDGVVDGCDNCMLVFNPLQEDVDADAVGDSCDNCILIFNPSQEDTDSDGVGDSCDKK